VIGVRKFAYDLWGDTVNLASRLEEYGEPGHVLVSESTARQLADRYDFAPTQILDVKGKGATPVRVVVSRRSDVPIAVPSSASPE
jgi:class 3 adenylate cyclase